jgi:hypothetical protein
MGPAVGQLIGDRTARCIGLGCWSDRPKVVLASPIFADKNRYRRPVSVSGDEGSRISTKVRTKGQELKGTRVNSLARPIVEC